MEEMLILVDKKDNVIGSEGKLSIHQQGLLHRAFSIFIFDSQGKLLLQQRAHGKYHSAGLWTNSCCGHPRWGECTGAAASRRLREEMGFSTRLKRVSSFIYHAEVSGGLIEYEFDHIYIGLFDGNPKVNPDEAADWLWIDIPQLIYKLEWQPERFTVWFRKIIDNVNINELKGWGEIISRE
ncbi:MULTISPECIES: isopentenyl-diphosphate Delta-isomerase [Serratia]|uniref:isopentenyl-diphosphate Delta-isomerase n=1 Tax=Serratia TaxID=613 RepID=UPI0007A01B77|nr:MULTISPECIES: isopentenyl-diphosphate Delta-isomerase [Serratia]KYQ96542.1 isopentenyl-diphosphate delta-isomerase [Serratia plymuthica]CAI1564612.1 Isopentenyl-diphosphate Delta-isomerase [Serratia entomophila]